MACAQTGSLLDHFSALRDPRQGGKVLYLLPEILLLVLCATLAGAHDFVAVRLWGEQALPFLRRLLPYEDGRPSHDTLGDVMNPSTRSCSRSASSVGSSPCAPPRAKPTVRKSSPLMARPPDALTTAPRAARRFTSSRPGPAASAWCSARRRPPTSRTRSGAAGAVRLPRRQPRAAARP